MNAALHLDLLGALPYKVRRPLEQLLALGHIERATIDDIIVAGDLAGDNTRLLAFAVSYLSLQRQGVPVHDVIAMSRAQGRRINLSWRAARWRSEHDRLSRAESLTRLAAEAIQYQVTKYEELLPSRFAGYLIRSSRRLGMEGFRQRHCVASYHRQLIAGYSAIAVVFVDKQRWTVQLACGLDGLLRISQVRSRLNALPSVDVQERIRLILRITIPTSTTDGAARCERRYMENMRRVLPVLRNVGVTSVTVSFDGSGDEGSIHDVYTEGGSIDTLRATVVRSIPECIDGVWQASIGLVDESVEVILHQITYDYLEETNVDWYNNDGGFGELVFDVIAGAVRLEVNVRSTESSCEYDRTVDVLTGEEPE